MIAGSGMGPEIRIELFWPVDDEALAVETLMQHSFRYQGQCIRGRAQIVPEGMGIAHHGRRNQCAGTIPDTHLKRGLLRGREIQVLRPPFGTGMHRRQPMDSIQAERTRIGCAQKG